MNIDLALLNVGCIRQQGGCDYPNVCSSFARIFWVIEGKGTVTFDGVPHRLTAGNLYLIPPLVTHHVHNEGSNTHFYIYFTDCTQHIYDHFGQHNYPFGVPVTEVDKGIIKRLMELAPHFSLENYNPQNYDHPQATVQRIRHFQQLPVATQMEISGLLQILLSHFTIQATPCATAKDRRIASALWTINHDLAAVPSLDELSAAACMNKNSFIRLFRQQTGYTPTDYIIRRRILHAQILFTNSHCNVKEVAGQVGYYNVSYFGRTFKRIVGISPLDFIRQNR